MKHDRGVFEMVGVGGNHRSDAARTPDPATEVSTSSAASETEKLSSRYGRVQTGSPATISKAPAPAPGDSR